MSPCGHAIVRDLRAELASQHQATPGGHFFDVVEFVGPENRIEEMPAFAQHVEHHAFVRSVSRDDLVLGQVLPPAVNTDQEFAGRNFNPLDFPVPYLL